MAKISCCYGCENREVGCHGSCERYIAEAQARKDEKAAKRIDNIAYHALSEGYTRRHSKYVKRAARVHL